MISSGASKNLEGQDLDAKNTVIRDAELSQTLCKRLIIKNNVPYAVS